MQKDHTHDEVARGELVPVMEAFCEPLRDYPYSPHRQRDAPAVRALVEHIRRSLQR